MKRLFILCTVLVLAGIGHVEASSIYNARQDFSGDYNPNGVWSYGYSTTLGDGISLFPDYGDSGAGDVPSWHNKAMMINYAPSLWMYDGDLHGYSPGPNDIGLHPGLWFNVITILRWTAPEAGTVDIDTVFSGADTGSKYVYVYHNANPIFGQHLDGFEITDYSTALTIQPGDTIDFAVAPGQFDDQSTACSTIIEFNPVPEPTTFIIWSSLTICVLFFGRRQCTGNRA